jgi:phosphate transport system substrate-binding protein
MFKTILMAAVVAGASLLSANSVQAETRVTGSGATFPNPLYLRWVAAFNEKNADAKIDYTAGGSGKGIKDLTARVVQFAGSDAPLTEEQTKALPAPVVHLPTVGGAVVLTYNLEGVNSLTLDGATVAGIYLGQIAKWNDPAIVKLNPGVNLPSTAIRVARRSDGSGTTFVFTSYLSAVNDTWKEKVGAAIDVKWPKGDGGKGNDGVADIVKNVPGTIGYVELAYADSKKLSFANLINKDGKTVKASAESINAAAAGMGKVPDDLIVSVINAAGADAYPIASYTYMLVYKDLKDGNLTKEQAEVVAKFLLWSKTEGQAMAPELNYAKLTPEMQEKVTKAVKALTFGGEPILK